MKFLRIVLLVLMGLNGLLMGIGALFAAFTGTENIMIPSLGLVVSVKLVILVFGLAQIAMFAFYNLLVWFRKEN